MHIINCLKNTKTPNNVLKKAIPAAFKHQLWQASRNMPGKSCYLIT